MANMITIKINQIQITMTTDQDKAANFQEYKIISTQLDNTFNTLSDITYIVQWNPVFIRPPMTE